MPGCVQEHTIEDMMLIKCCWRNNLSEWISTAIDQKEQGHCWDILLLNFCNWTIGRSHPLSSNSQLFLCENLTWSHVSTTPLLVLSSIAFSESYPPSTTMKFRKNLQRVVDISNPEWAPYWINYKVLKVGDLWLAQPVLRRRSFWLSV